MSTGLDAEIVARLAKRAALMTTPPDRRVENGSTQSRDESGKMLPKVSADSGTKFGNRGTAEEKQEQIHRAILRAPSEVQRQAPLFTPKPLAPYAKGLAQSTGQECPRCSAVNEHWIVRVFADAQEVRLCRPCWKDWDARQKARAA